MSTGQWKPTGPRLNASSLSFPIRSRPIARISAQFSLNVSSINLNDKPAFCSNDRNKQRAFCFELTLCQTLAIKHAEHLDDDPLLATTLQLDVFKLANLVNHSSIYAPSASSSRAYFELNSNYQPKYKTFYSNNSTTTNSVNFQTKLRPNMAFCYPPFLVMLRVSEISFATVFIMNGSLQDANWQHFQDNNFIVSDYFVRNYDRFQLLTVFLPKTNLPLLRCFVIV